MLHIHTLVQAKKTARALEKALLKAGIELKHGKALDALAAMCGQLDWNSFAKSLDPSVLDSQLRDFELSHMENSGDDDFGPEAMLVAHTGFQLRYSAETEMCEYVRVCDPLGRELMYWNSDEWAEDPQLVMGAILGALVRGRPAEAVKPVRTTKPASVAAVPRIQDVDFMAAHAVIFAGRCYSIDWREESVLARLANPASEDFEDWSDSTALHLQYQEDGLVYSESLTLEDLAALRWDSDKKAFVDPKGQTYQFFFEVSASEWFSSRPVSQSAKPGVSEPAPPTKGAVALYRVQGAFADRKSGQEVPVVARIAGYDQFDALARVRAVYDSSLHVLRVDEVTPAVEAEAGPFSVYVDGGVYDSVPYLRDAVNLAEVLAPTGNDEVTVEDKDHNVVWRLDATGEEA